MANRRLGDEEKIEQAILRSCEQAIQRGVKLELASMRSCELAIEQWLRSVGRKSCGAQMNAESSDKSFNGQD